MIGAVSFEGTPGVTDSGHCASSTGTVDVDTTGCSFVLTGETTGEDEGVDATAWVACEEEGEIRATVTELGITISFPSQTPTSGGVTYSNVEMGGQQQVEGRVTATGITYTCSPAFLCGLGGVSTEGNNADLNGSVTIASASGNNIQYSEE